MQKVSDIEQNKTTILPRHRHGVLQLLMEQLRRARMPAAEAAPASPPVAALVAAAEGVAPAGRPRTPSNPPPERTGGAPPKTRDEKRFLVRQYKIHKELEGHTADPS